MVEFETADAHRAKVMLGAAKINEAVTVGNISGALTFGMGWANLLRISYIALLDDALGVPTLNSPDDLARAGSRQVRQETVEGVECVSDDFLKGGKKIPDSDISPLVSVEMPQLATMVIQLNCITGIKLTEGQSTK